jgi:hypothetical protein
MNTIAIDSRPLRIWRLLSLLPVVLAVWHAVTRFYYSVFAAIAAWVETGDHEGIA